MATDAPKKLRIAHVLAHLGPGGVPRVALTLAGEMARRGHEVRVVTWEPQRAFELPAGVRHDVAPIVGLSRAWRRTNAVRWLGRKVFGTRLWRFLLSSWFCRQLGRQALADARPDVVFFHGLYFLPFWRFEATRHFVVVHNLKSRMLLGSRWPAVDAVQRRIFHRAYAGKRLVTVSRGIGADLARHFGVDERNLTCIHNPFDFAAIRRQAGQPLPPQDAGGRDFIVAVGRLSRQKRLDLLIRAYQRSGVAREVDLWILGRGSQETPLRKLADDLGVAARVRFLGFRSNPHPYMRRARLLVLSSEFEGFANVIVEALLCGTPVVSFACPSGPDEILTGAMARGLVPPGDVDALARALRDAVASPPPVEDRALGRFEQGCVAAAYLELARCERSVASRSSR